MNQPTNISFNSLSLRQTLCLLFVLIIITLPIFYLWQSTLGLKASFFLLPSKVPFSVDRVLTLNYTHITKLQAPYWRHWSIDQDGFPQTHVQPYVIFTGYLDTPTAFSSNPSITLTASPTIRATLDSKVIVPNQPTNIKPGIHPLHIEFQPTDNQVQLQLALQHQSKSSVLINPLYLYPSTSAISTRQTTSPILIILLCTQLVLMVFVLTHYRYRLTRILSQPKVLLLAIFIFGSLLRIHQYDFYPPLHETEDEQGLAWHGISLVSQGIPRSWLFADYFNPTQVYPDTNLKFVNWFGEPFWIGQPYFDNPPFVPFLVGIVSRIAGITNIFNSKLWVARLIPLGFSLANIFLIYFYTNQLYHSKRLSLLASFFYAFTPLIIVSNRLLKEENILACLFLLIGIFVHKYLTTNRPNHIYITSIVSGLAFLSKETSLAAILTVILLLLSQHKFKAVYQYLLGLLPFIGFYFFYGLPWDLHLLFASIKLNSTKTLNLVSWIRFITNRQGSATNSFAFFFYPLMLIGLFSVGKKLDSFSRTLTSIYILIMGALIYGTAWGFFGWYKTALYPFFTLALALVFRPLFNQKTQDRTQTRLFFFLYTIVFSIFYPLTLLHLADSKRIIYGIAILGFLYIFTPQLLPQLKHRRFSFLLLILFVLFSTSTILFQDRLYFINLPF